MSLRHKATSLNVTQSHFGDWINSGAMVEDLSSLDLRVPHWDVGAVTHFSFMFGLALELDLGE